ncbi:AAA family ATPase [Corynebacterium epidermidicanis]|uniref:AAA domain n=1 Tax=Corynebacterium epidermidicanis TaxID=1050174 RepID=A0A0G3GP47_9CORY|nr:AAA family ATPase [Corynebacterium epidermidicanis]AKK02330.1 AAA domain [Corynebacterium epidermidicanis]
MEPLIKPHKPAKYVDPEAPELPAFHILTREEIDAIPDLEPLIKGVIDQGTVAMLAAQPAAGKTFLALDWACCYATGKRWQGHDTEATGNVLYIAAEGARGIKQRLNAWEQAWKTTVPAAAFHLIDKPVNLGSILQVERLIGQIEAGEYGLVVVDTVARCSLGLEENSATDMGKVVDSLYRIREAMGDHGTVLAVHHTGKSGEVRGSSALLGGVDQLMKLERSGGGLILQDEKRKDGRGLAPIGLRLSESHGSMIIESDAPEFREADHTLLIEMAAIRNALPLTLPQLKAAVDMHDRDVYRQLSYWIDQGRVTSTNEKNPRYNLVEEQGFI